MTTQLIEAARLALEVLEAEVVSVDKYAKATTELRAALSVSSIQCEETSHALEQPARGCDYCNHPQYAGIKCKNCGRVTEQPAQDEPVGFYDAENKDLRTKIPLGEEGDWWEPVYTSPANSLNSTESSKMLDAQAREPLTDEQIADAVGWNVELGGKALPREIRIARAIEAAHGIKGEA